MDLLQQIIMTAAGKTGRQQTWWLHSNCNDLTDSNRYQARTIDPPQHAMQQLFRLVSCYDMSNIAVQPVLRVYSAVTVFYRNSEA